MTAPEARLLALGEEAWILTLGDRIAPGLHERVVAVASLIGAAALPGVREIVPGYTTVTVSFDSARANAEELRVTLERLLAESPIGLAVPSPRTVDIPVRYDGPDLEEVAGRTGLSRNTVVERHSARLYRVYLLGFAPGFAYLGELDPSLELPRRQSPRTRVPPGSVAIAGLQTAVYPLATPGGWHLIGTTSLHLFDPASDPPALLSVGDRVRFVPIGVQ
jgi:KipI family sensor histidine kinase inhibitor